MKNPATVAFATLGLLLASGSAFAGPAATSVPEPMSMSLLVGGVLAIAAVKRWRGR